MRSSSENDNFSIDWKGFDIFRQNKVFNTNIGDIEKND